MDELGPAAFDHATSPRSLSMDVEGCQLSSCDDSEPGGAPEMGTRGQWGAWPLWLVPTRRQSMQPERSESRQAEVDRVHG